MAQQNQPPPDPNVSLQALGFLLQQHISEARTFQIKLLQDIESLRAEARTSHIAAQRVANDQMETDLYVTKLRRRVRKLERADEEERDENTPTRGTPRDYDPENTGNWKPDEAKKLHEIAATRIQLENLAKRIDEEDKVRRDSGIWWKRQRVLWIAAVITAILMSGCTVATGLITWKITSSAKK